MIRRTLIAAATTAALLSGCASTSTAPAASAAAPLDLYLVRHGQTQWNLDKRLQGSTDNPLDATGRDPEHAVVAATTGVLEIMDDAEREGVMAHELGHVRNYDIRVSMIVYGLVVAVGMVADVLMRAAFFGRNSNGNPVVLIFGLVAMIVAPIVASLVRTIDELSSAVVAAAMVLPIVALAPVLYGMFSASQQTARQLVASLAVFVPVYVNTLKGLRQVRPVHRDLMRAHAAGTWQTIGTVTLPTALPFIFTGVRIASSLAVIAAVIAEYFGGPKSGLGGAITTAAAGSNYPLAWAYVLGSIILGLVFYLAVLGIEKWVLRNRGV